MTLLQKVWLAANSVAPLLLMSLPECNFLLFGGILDSLPTSSVQYGLLLTLDGSVSPWNPGFFTLVLLRMKPESLTAFAYILITIMVTTAT
mmetsp:Transcript_44088/g.71976  ORF Transcript_44088/g.71976 Transcript_44088/m.71976 type:complete len:91 (+) Transcript_44088:471-743(+)